MKYIKHNLKLQPALKLSSWRKLAMGTWRSAGDPSVYGGVPVRADKALDFIEKLREETGEHITMTHLVGSALAYTLKKHPEINTVKRFGRLYPRQTIDIFFQIATDPEGKDLSGTVIREADSKSPVDMAKEMNDKISTIRKRGDAAYRKSKNLVGMFPGVFSGTILDTSSFILNKLNLWFPALGVPRDPFGSVMVTNVGSLGIKEAYVPLVPYSGVPLLISLGSVDEAPIVEDHQIKVGKVIKVCATFDHRIIDGVHAGKMSKTLTEILEDPEAHREKLNL